MRCPFCSACEDKVIDSRQSKDGGEIRRRRECVGCDRRFTTYERVEEALPAVIKTDSKREPFDRNKIERGLARALAKRPVASSEIERIAEAVERQVCELGVGELSSREIGELVLPRLRELDQIAYVRYASIYRDFRDVDEFASELTNLKKDSE